MRINLLQLGTQGVDMKSNPLLLSNKKLHSATNLTFDEGVIRTRPGFTYKPLGATGQFQGACEYRPAQGLSALPLSEALEGIALVAGGSLWFNCTKISDEFCGKGDVNLFQAENYLVVSCLATDTFWWDGVTLTQSPGLNEVEWQDPETPVFEFNVERPVADIPDCEIVSVESGVTVTFRVVDAATEQILPGAAITVYRNGTRAYKGTTDSQGVWARKMTPRNYTYAVTKAGYTDVDGPEFPVTGEDAERFFNGCIPPDVVVTGDVEVNVRMISPIDPFNIHGFLTVAGTQTTPGVWASGVYDLSAFFGVNLTPAVPIGNAYRTAWRLHTDACGVTLEYFRGAMDDNGRLLATGTTEMPVSNISAGSGAYFNPADKKLYSTYEYSEGIYLQFGVLVEGVWLWANRTPCIAGGNGTI